MMTEKNLITRSNFESVAKELLELHEKKNHDYGNAFGDTYQEFAAIHPQMANGYAIGLLKAKVSRLISLCQGDPQVVNESKEDSLKDLASYAIMTLVEMRNSNLNDDGTQR